MDTYTTAQILAALIERATFTNGLDHCRVTDIMQLHDLLGEALASIPPEPFGEALLLVLVDLHTGANELPDDLFYAILDNMTDDEAMYYTECSEAIYNPNY